MAKEEMCFYHNGEKQPVTLSGFGDCVRPLVGFYSAMPKCISLVEFHTDDTSVGASGTSTRARGDAAELPAAGTESSLPAAQANPLSSTSTPASTSLASAAVSGDTQSPAAIPLQPAQEHSANHDSLFRPAGPMPPDRVVAVPRPKSHSDPLPSNSSRGQQAAPSSESQSPLNNLTCGFDDFDDDDSTPRFRQSRCVGDSFLVTNRGKTLRRHANQHVDIRHHDNVFAYLGPPLTRPGVYHWQLLLEQDEGATTLVGVAREGAVRRGNNEVMYSSSGMWLWRSYEGRLYGDGFELDRRLEEFNTPGSVVGLTLDTEKGTLECQLDGVGLGPAFHGLTLPLTPVVAFYGSLAKRIMLLDYKWPKSENTPPVKTSPRRVDIVDRPIPDGQCYLCRSSGSAESSGGGTPAAVVTLQPCSHSLLCFEHATVCWQQKGTCPRCETVICGLLNRF